MTGTGVVAAKLRVGTGPASLVLNALRVGGPSVRDQVAQRTGLSAATVNRQITALTAAGLLDERPDLLDGRGVGRPKVPLSLDRDRFCVAGIHIGARRTALVIADIGGRTLYSHAIRTQELSGVAAEVAVQRLCTQLAELAARFSGRQLLWAGAALGGSVDATTGTVDHPILGWRSQRLGLRLHETLGVPVSVAEHVQAMAAAELLLGGEVVPHGAALFFYARETVGMAMIIEDEVHQPTRGAGSIAALPVAPGPLDTAPVAPLQSVIGTAARKAAAARLGCSDDATALDDARARVLGESVAVMRDVINPDSVIVAGDAFAAHPRGLEPVQAAFDAATTTGWPLEIVPTRFGVHVPETAPIAVALAEVYGDPLAVVGSGH
ncbi:putative NagC family transcriptional regulator [Gordonia hirsuta DSM 44140 = NBRC 16056]|uniref:Putative NagC family transcriptional regulator n=1 Tax=Gordonia hirsuta DSM 44140 = NBRC 16056 TaxID=1121927 RepID=L7LA60_9ACTN|nr:ROK family transcriptional regulator [Gordonia hirsuta]GAC56923.1 putative NagC family transcriptional regulator [Gordonia hirsuta DSM 44140 = NBRC 16056]